MTVPQYSLIFGMHFGESADSTDSPKILEYC